MILRMYTLTLEPEHPLRFSADELRLYLNQKMAEYTSLHRENTAGYIYRYPVVQVKLVKSALMVTGISQGADCLYYLIRNQTKLGSGENICRITSSDKKIQEEPLGVTDTVVMYEFVTPWLALNQQNAKKFYDLNGKLQRDAFMQNLLTAQLTTLAKSLDYAITVPVRCEAKVRFRRDRIGRDNVMVFLGKFRTNFHIPDYLGIGLSISQGYGTIKRITESSDIYSGEP
jgi:hypothetical protein